MAPHGVRKHCECTHPERKTTEFDVKLEKCIIVGYSSKQKAYKCFNPSTGAVRVSHDVVFDESASWYEPDLAPSDPIEEELNANSCWEICPSEWNRMKDAENRLIAEPAPIGSEPIGWTEM